MNEDLRKAHDLLASMGDLVPPPDGRPEHVRHRDAYRLWSDQFPVPAGTVVTDAPGFAGLSVRTAASDPSRAILYFHGGGYTEGSAHGHREVASRLATGAEAVVHLPDYPLAPENPFPAAVHGAVEAYRLLLDSGLPASRIGVGGDSAGGGLALSLLVFLKELALPLPAAVVAVSPWTDMTLTSDTFRTLAARDPFVSREALTLFAQRYLRSECLLDPLASPLFADLAGLPPLLIEVGSEEVLLDDSRKLYARAREFDVDARLVVTEGAPHIWQHFGSFLPEARESLARIATHFRSHIPA
ncbi:alpha/beta hydrolase fold domain-containing protein [Lentzea sp. JNUCC 0626]|uniref:alpha/beta hydrolase fold domain-containing protein n=1 Tax=Lentzea sp. JNUCC 0626 TaxID=3367513 RepID=UPI003749E234